MQNQRRQFIDREVPDLFWKADGYQEILIEGCIFTNGITKHRNMKTEYEIEQEIEAYEQAIEEQYEAYRRELKQQCIDKLAYADYCARVAADYAT